MAQSLTGVLPDGQAVAHRAPARTSGLSRGAFFDATVARLRARLPAERTEFRRSSNPMLLKLDFGNERVHYEVAPDAARGHVEVGLHFEDGPISTAAYLAWFDRHIVELKHELGAAVELERWTASWGRLYELRPLVRLDAALADAVADRLCAFVVLLQPLVEEAAVVPERSAEAAGREGPWRAWRRGRR